MADLLKDAMRYNPAGHGVCSCRGASCHPQAQSIGEIGTIGYLIGGVVKCAACASKAAAKTIKGKSK